MKLSDLIDGIEVQLIQGPAQLPITDISDDSRTATPGCAFIARPGTQDDGTAHIDHAIERGATSIISHTPPPTKPITSPFQGQPITWVQTHRINQQLCGYLAERFFDHPSQKLQLIGITGTNGKTTTAFLTQHLLQHAGLKTGLITTVQIDVGSTTIPAQLTTPSAIDLSRHLAAMVSSGCRAAVIEVSSHALHQGRTSALKFNTAVFTNLTGDHLDYHHTMQHYAAAKAKLFQQLLPDAQAVVNADDPHVQTMVHQCVARKIWCTVRSSPSDLIPTPWTDSSSPPTKLTNHHSRATIHKLTSTYSQTNLNGPWGSHDVQSPLVGRHNVANLLHAVAAANTIVPLSSNLNDALRTCPNIPGRLEPVQSPSPQSPAVFVDFAHTHDALENVLLALRPATKGQLIVLFGCGGDRDRTKRPRMAQVAYRLADLLVITSDNPRTEDPDSIIQEILTGIPRSDQPSEHLNQHRSSKVIVQPDRATAIAMTIALAAAQDTVLLAGKGHENHQLIGSNKIHFNDCEHANKAIRLKLTHYTTNE